MEKTVESLDTEVRTELNDGLVDDLKKSQQFEINQLSDKVVTDPELWALSYRKLYSGLFATVDLILQNPVNSKDADINDVYEGLNGSMENLVDKFSNSELNTEPILNIRNRVQEFQKSGKDEFTLRLTIHGGKSSIEYMNKYFEDGIISVDLNGSPTKNEEVTLREYEDSLVDSFCGFDSYEKRPNTRFKREMTISMKKTDDSIITTIDLNTERMKYTLLEKIFNKIGLSKSRKEEPINQLV